MMGCIWQHVAVMRGPCRKQAHYGARAAALCGGLAAKMVRGVACGGLRAGVRDGVRRGLRGTSPRKPLLRKGSSCLTMLKYGECVLIGP